MIPNHINKDDYEIYFFVFSSANNFFPIVLTIQKPLLPQPLDVEQHLGTYQVLLESNGM